MKTQIGNPDDDDAGVTAMGRAISKLLISARAERPEAQVSRPRGRKIGKRTIISQDDAEAWLHQLPALAVTKTTS